MHGLVLRPILAAERDSLAWWIDHAPFAHIHVGWLTPARWVGRPVSLQLVDRHDRTHAALLACPDMLQVAWVQGFACSRKLAPPEAWHTLWEAAREVLIALGISRVWAMSSESPFAAMLQSAGFRRTSEVVTLTYLGEGIPLPPPPPGISLRRLNALDLPAILALDNASFRAPWQMDREALETTFAASAIGTVAMSQEDIVGYLLATQSQGRLHLARLATAPAWQRGGIGRALTCHLLQLAKPPAVSNLTVNTQIENSASLQLYRALGFHEGGRGVPVYGLDLPLASGTSPN
jgi:ribosomal-protein-alanine N-acetyltransferase